MSIVMLNELSELMERSQDRREQMKHLYLCVTDAKSRSRFIGIMRSLTLFARFAIAQHDKI